MAKKPKLTEDSFLQNLFSPKKYGIPSGLRKRPVVGGKGRKSARVAAYNRMAPVKQELLFRSGKREAYLRGEATLRDAKEALRPKAVERGFAKVLRAVAPKVDSGPGSRRRRLDAFIEARIRRQLIDHGKEFNPDTISQGVQMISDREYEAARSITYGQLRLFGRDQSRKVIFPDGTERNPYWYH